TFSSIRVTEWPGGVRAASRGRQAAGMVARLPSRGRACSMPQYETSKRGLIRMMSAIGRRASGRGSRDDHLLHIRPRDLLARQVGAGRGAAGPEQYRLRSGSAATPVAGRSYARARGGRGGRRRVVGTGGRLRGVGIARAVGAGAHDVVMSRGVGDAAAGVLGG